MARDRKQSSRQWRRQLLGTFNDFIFSSFWSKSESQLSKYSIV